MTSQTVADAPLRDFMVGGARRRSAGRTSVIYPYTGEIVASVANAGPADVEDAIAAAVEAFAAEHEVLHREALGGFTRLTVRGADPDQAARLGLAVEPVSLQQLVVRATTAATGSPTATVSDTSDDTLERIGRP